MKTYPCDVKNCPAVVSDPALRYCPVHRAMAFKQRQEAHEEAERRQFHKRTLRPVTDQIEREKP